MENLMAFSGKEEVERRSSRKEKKFSAFLVSMRGVGRLMLILHSSILLILPRFAHEFF